MELSLEQVGFLGGDFSWWKADLEWTQFFLLGTDDQGRNRVLRWNARVGNIFDSVPRVPLWERYYLGGNSLRGFENRTISPKSVRASDGEPSSDPIGGSFLALRACNTSIHWSVKILPLRSLLIREPFLLNLGWSHGGWRPVSVAASICPSWVQSPWPSIWLGPSFKRIWTKLRCCLSGRSCLSEPRSLDGVSCTT